MGAKRTDSSKVLLNAVESRACDDLMNMREFVALSERLLKEELDGLAPRIDKRLSCLPVPDQEAELGCFYDDICQLSEIFPRIQRYSLYTSLLSMIEHHLSTFCWLAKKVCEVKCSAADLKGNGITQSLNYFIKVCDFPISRSEKPDYDHLKTFQKMRNAIVHNDGRPSGNNLTTIQQYKKRHLDFDVTERNQIILSSGFLYRVLATAERFYKILLAELEKRI